jgi:hypothetical protein
LRHIDDADIELSIGVRLRSEGQPPPVDVYALGFTSITAPQGFNRALVGVIHRKIQAAGADGIEPAELFVGSLVSCRSLL